MRASARFLFLCILAAWISGNGRVTADQLGNDRESEQTDFDVAAAKQWRQQVIDELDDRLDRLSDDPAGRRELEARRQWLMAWTPGKMIGLRTMQAEESGDAEPQRDEPDLADTLAAVRLRDDLPADVASELRPAARMQQRLRQLDSEETRKANLSVTIELASKLGHALTDVLDSLPADDDELRRQVRWSLAYTRYRRARALAYRELPEVLESTPIQDSDRYERRLRVAHQRLRQTFAEPQSEFVLLEVRMLRREDDRGQALQKLERFRDTIDPKWYLKKRRDLLGELQWGPAHAEAARLYAESGLDEEGEPED